MNTTTINSFPELFQLELSLKMFSETITPYINSLLCDALKLMNNCKNTRSKTVHKIIQHIQNQLESSMNTSIDTTIVNKMYPTVPFVKVDLDYLNVLNSKYEKIDKILKSFKLSLIDNISNNSLDNLTILSVDSEMSSIMRTENAVSFNYNEELNKSNTSIDSNILLNNSVSLDESSKEHYLKNHSLEHADERNVNISQISTPAIPSFDDIFNAKELPSTDKSSFNNFPLENNNNDNKLVEVEQDQNHYWLRHCPKSTDHFCMPYQPTKTKKKFCKNNTNYNDLTINKGKGKKQITLKYKFHSVLNDNSCSNNNSKNSTLSNISINPRKKDKPCRCGIYSSQVPPSWNNLMHENVHQNLYKLNFKSQNNIEFDVLCKVNDNGFLYNIIKITKDNDNDRKLKSSLKNIREFIDLELDFSNKKIKSINHSIFLAINPNSKIIGYLEIDFLENACIYQNNRLSDNLVAVKFGVSKIWVMVKYRNNGVGTKLLKQFQDDENLKENDIAFAYPGSYGISFIKKYYGNNSILIY